MIDKERDPEEIVATIAFTTPDLTSDGNRAGVLLHLKVDDPCESSDVYKWLMTVMQGAGVEFHWELCGMGDTTSPT
jgi:hypothetical protein